jgi:hypothetical protein
MAIDSRQELEVLIDILAQVINVVNVSSIADQTERERKTDAHNLANRFFQYALTILFLSNNTHAINLPSFNHIKITDPASIDVLTRANMEAFLVFHHVFYSPKSQDEKVFRYCIYKAVGIAERQNLFKNTSEHQKQKYEEKKKIESIIENLKDNQIFKNLSQKQKDGIATGRQRDLWRWDSVIKNTLPWYKIAVDAGFSKMLAQHMYSHLSGHAHSGSLSVLQTQQSIVNKEVEKLIIPSLNTVKILTANMINHYTTIFNDAHDKLIETGAVNFVDIWIEVGKNLDNNI